MKFKKNWTMNFIIDLSLNKRSEQIYDFILIIIDCYTKYFKYISTKKDWTMKQFANQLFNEIFSKHEMSKSIMFNKDSLFIFNFWFNFCYHLKIKNRLNIVFHSQTDDQTKKQNQTLKQYLRIYVNYQQNNWVKLLFVTELRIITTDTMLLRRVCSRFYIETKMSQDEKIKFKKILKRRCQRHDSKF
jgi:hypothetical protein